MKTNIIAKVFCWLVLSNILAVQCLPTQIRFMNAQYDNNNLIGLTTDTYTTSTSIQAQGRLNNQVGSVPIPSTSYLTLPTSLIPLRTELTFYTYNVNDTNVPINALANTTAMLFSGQSYALVYVAQTRQDLVDDRNNENTGNVPTTSFTAPSLFLFEEQPDQLDGTSFVKIINVAVSTAGSDSLKASILGSDYYIPFGQSSNFLSFNGGLTLTLTVSSAYSNKTIPFTTSYNATTVIYIRGDQAYPADLGYNIAIVSIDSRAFSSPSNSPVGSPVAESTIDNSLPIKLRLVNGLQTSTNLTLSVEDNDGTTRSSTANLFGSYVTLASGSGDYAIQIMDSNSNVITSTSLNLFAGKSYSYVVYDTTAQGILVEDFPITLDPSLTYAQIVNARDTTNTTFAQLLANRAYSLWFLNSGEQTGFQLAATQFNVFIDTLVAKMSYNVVSGTASTIFVFGNDTSATLVIDTQAFPTQGICVHGYVESTGVCNCYSGYASDASLYQCTARASDSCFTNQTDDLSNSVVPYLSWEDTEVVGSQLLLSVLSTIMPNRRTIIELPNAQCNYINSPQYYKKLTSGCEDRINMNVPYAKCFTKTLTADEIIYKGSIHVKQIDQVTVGGVTQDRVIDTPFPVSIRMPKTLAIQSRVEVYGPPSLALDAAFVGQTVSTDTQSATLQYLTSVQYPLEISDVDVVDLPYGVSAWVEVVNGNCSNVGSCVQRLIVHLNTTTCTMSGLYKLAASFTCRSNSGCPDDAKNGTQVFLVSNIVSQSLCGQVSIDIDLSGTLQAYSDNAFSSPALAFYPGQSAYFLITASSSRVTLSSVKLDSVFYYGPNVNYEYLYFDNSTTATNVAVASNFKSGSSGSSRAWFSVDVSVSTPQSSQDTLFKLAQGQNGVYNFVAVVDVEWLVASATNKKRMVLEGTMSNQGPQFTAQVQIAGPTTSEQVPSQAQIPFNSVVPTDSGKYSVATSLQQSMLLICFVFVISCFF